jgi:hypothetical protein
MTWPLMALCMAEISIGSMVWHKLWRKAGGPHTDRAGLEMAIEQWETMGPTACGDDSPDRDAGTTIGFPWRRRVGGSSAGSRRARSTRRFNESALFSMVEWWVPAGCRRAAFRMPSHCLQENQLAPGISNES